MDENQELTPDSESATISTELTETKITQVNIEELESQLNEAIDNEDYELASKIRDEINKRSQS